MTDLVGQVVIVIIFVIFIIAMLRVTKFVATDGNQGKPSERANNPELSTNNKELHLSRLKKFGKSKYRGQMYFLGKRGGIYTVSPSGTRTYRY